MAETLAAFLSAQSTVARVTLSRVRGSSPREEGVEMFVAPTTQWGTIGGGQLEYMAIDKARALLRSGMPAAAMDVPLGPDIGQCCGGRVWVTLDRMDATARKDALAREATERLHRPAVLVMGAGHVGRALADQLQHLPVRSVLVDTRARELGLCDAAVEKRLTALPEADIRAAAPGSAFLILTHDHALDFLLAAEALGRGDAAYTGMIGSRTKRSAFVNWCRRQAGVDPGALICPIGAGATGDKRPAVIAALTVAEVMSALTRARVPQQAAVR